MSDHYNPYEDETLQCIKPEKPQEIIDHEKGFNDVINYFDVINGHQIPKHLDRLPKKYRKLFRWAILISLIWAFGALILQVISIIFEIIHA